MNARNNHSGLLRKASAFILTLALCTLGTTLAFASTFGAPTTYKSSTAGGSVITNTASATYSFGTATPTTTSNTVTVYVNQLDSFYIVANDYASGIAVPSTQTVVTAPGVPVALAGYSIYNLSNGPITLTLALDVDGVLAAALKSSLPGNPAGTFQPTPGNYSYALTGGTLAVNTITIPQQTTPAVLTVTVTPPSNASAGPWDIFTLTLTDATVSTNPGNYAVTKYNSSSSIWNVTYGGLDTQVTSEVDVFGGLNFGKLQLLDQLCTGVTFSTTSVAGGVRATPSTAVFPTITWNALGTANAGQPVTGTVGLLDVSANPGECIVYRVVLNNPLPSTSIATWSITDTLSPKVTLMTTPVAVAAKLTGATGTITSNNVTGLTAIAQSSTTYLQYEVQVIK